MSRPDVVDPAGGRWIVAEAPEPASFERDIIPESTLPGADPRDTVGAPSSPPYAAIGVLNFFRHGQLVMVGTGFCCAPDVLVTARHNLTKVQYDSAGLWMAYDGHSNAAVPPVPIAAFAMHRTLDLAILILGTRQDATLALDGNAVPGGTARLAGYGYSYDDGRPRFSSAQGPLLTVGADEATYRISTQEGDSGAPVLTTAAGPTAALAVHVEPPGAAGGGNVGLRLTPAVIADLKVMETWARTQAGRNG